MLVIPFYLVLVCCSLFVWVISVWFGLLCSLSVGSAVELVLGFTCCGWLCLGCFVGLFGLVCC